MAATPKPADPKPVTPNIEQVERVLLTDGWHVVADKSFTLGSYELDVPRNAPGFSFKNTTGRWISGPLSSILALDSRRTDG